MKITLDDGRTIESIHRSMDHALEFFKSTQRLFGDKVVDMEYKPGPNLMPKTFDNVRIAFERWWER